jgi:hypothetical protein
MCAYLVFESSEEMRFSQLKFPYNSYYCVRRIDEGAALGTNESLCPYLSALEECPDFCSNIGNYKTTEDTELTESLK